MTGSVAARVKQYGKGTIPYQKNKLLGEILVEAGLISETQLKLALQNQSMRGYEELRLGEILAMRGWVPQETCDFFAVHWEQLILSLNSRPKRKIGSYLSEANLLSESQIQAILKMQQTHKILFGKLAVAQGFLKQQTVDFFMENLTGQEHTKSRIDTCLERAEKYFRLSDNQGALLELREAIRIDRSHPKAHAWLALIYLNQKQISASKVHLKKALSAAPNDKFVKEVKQWFLASATSKRKESSAPLGHHSRALAS